MRKDDEEGTQHPEPQNTFENDVKEISHYLAESLTEQIDQIEKTFIQMLSDVRGLSKLLVSARISSNRAREAHLPPRLLKQIHRLDKQMRKLEKLPPVMINLI